MTCTNDGVSENVHDAHVWSGSENYLMFLSDGQAESEELAKLLKASQAKTSTYQC